MAVSLQNRIPDNGATGVNPDTTIYLEITDPVGSIILAQVTIKVEGETVYTAGAAVPPWVVNVTPLPGVPWGVAVWGSSTWGASIGYGFLITPLVPFDYGQVVNVDVTYP